MKWFSTPATARHRKPITLTISEAGRKALEWLASTDGESQSRVVDELCTRESARRQNRLKKEGSK